jgi:hypothetical protein
MPSTVLDLEFWPVRVKDVKDVPSSPVSIPPSLGISEPLMRVEILYQPMSVPLWRAEDQAPYAG